MRSQAYRNSLGRKKTKIEVVTNGRQLHNWVEKKLQWNDALYNMFAECFYNGFLTAVDMQLAVNVFQVKPCCIKGNGKFRGDHFCAVSLY